MHRALSLPLFELKILLGNNLDTTNSIFSVMTVVLSAALCFGNRCI
jgi:hypothetical protein